MDNGSRFISANSTPLSHYSNLTLKLISAWGFRLTSHNRNNEATISQAQIRNFAAPHQSGIVLEGLY